jgi:phosphatidylglycerol---prolipoprotein diacylglyceryl transferase
MIPYPQIDPVIFSVGPAQIRWYSLFYIISFVIGYIFIKKNIRAKDIKISDDHYDTLLFLIMLGVVIGARFGYVLFYGFADYLSQPWRVFAFWEGGMSFHGGVIAVILFGLIYVRKKRLDFYGLADAVVPFAALGLGLGRIGNFINGELYGRVTDVPWAMVFPGTDGRPRHPSQLYQALFEGFLLFVVLQFCYRRIKSKGTIFWMFVGLYGIIRFVIEFFRQPDAHLGFVISIFTMGQILCFVMIILSAIGLYFVHFKKDKQ